MSTTDKKGAAEAPKAGQDPQKAVADFTKEMYQKQLEIFAQWNEVIKKNMPDPQTSKELSEIVMRHFQKLAGKADEILPKDGKMGPEIVDAQQRLFLEFVNGYNEMLKEIMATPNFTSTVGAAMTKAMTQQKDAADQRDVVARAFGIPTRTDIRDIHESIYFLNKRLDVIEKMIKEIRGQTKK